MKRRRPNTRGLQDTTEGAVGESQNKRQVRPAGQGRPEAGY